LKSFVLKTKRGLGIELRHGDRRKQNGGLGAKPRRCGDLTAFFQKNTQFCA